MCEPCERRLDQRHPDRADVRAEWAAAGAGRDLLARFAPVGPAGEPAKVVDAGQVVFVAAGSNFVAVSCPRCAATIDLDRRQDRVDVASSSDFTNLMVRTPCCDVTTSLNDLRYDWAQGFARWRPEVMNPAIGTLSAGQLAEIAAAIGHEVRAVYLHL